VKRPLACKHVRLLVLIPSHCFAGLVLGGASGTRSETSGSGPEDARRQCTSVLNLPTYVCNGEKVPFEVLERLTPNRLYPSLVAGSRNFGDHGNKCLAASAHPLVIIPHPSVRRESCVGCHDRTVDKEPPRNATAEDAYLWWLKKMQDCHHSSRRNSALQVRDLKIPR
jgi:hypothetical protein